MIEILVAIMAGCAIGVVGGLLPSISNSMVMLSLFFLLAKLDITVVICFYISLLVASQYTGSVAATLLGTLGESSSMPALREGRTMYSQGNAKWALAISAWGSLVGSIIAAMMGAILLTNSQTIFALTYTEIRVAFFALLIMMFVFFGHNKWTTNLVMISAGLMLGYVGYNEDTNQTWGTFGISALSSGIPMMTVLICLYGLPLLLQQRLSLTSGHTITQQSLKPGWVGHLPKGSIIRGSVIGFFSGLIPNLTYVAASNFAWIAEKWLGRKRYHPGDANSLAAAETANNSAVLSSLIPFVVFMVPIQLSEVILLNILRSSGQVFDPTWLWQPGIAVALLSAFLLSNLLAFLIAWPGGQWLVDGISRNEKWIVMTVSVIMLAGLGYEAWQVQQILYWTMIGSILFVVGWMLNQRNFDLIPFVIGFVVSKPMIMVFSIWAQKITFIY